MENDEPSSGGGAQEEPSSLVPVVVTPPAEETNQEVTNMEVVEEILPPSAAEMESALRSLIAEKTNNDQQMMMKVEDKENLVAVLANYTFIDLNVEKAKVMIALPGLIQLCMDLVKSGETTMLKRRGCLIIGNIAAVDVDQRQPLYAVPGLLNVIIEAASAPGADTKVKTAAVFVASLLSEVEESKRPLFLNSDVVKLAMEVLSLGDDQEKIEAATLLRNLGENEESKVPLFQYPGLMTCVVQTLLSNDASTSLKGAMAGILANIASKNMHELFLVPDLVDAVVKQLDTDDDYMQYATSLVLCNLASVEENQTVLFKIPLLVEKVVNCLKEAPNDEDATMNFVNTLWFLSQPLESKQSLCAVPHLVGTMGTLLATGSTEEIQTNAADVLLSLSEEPANDKFIKEHISKEIAVALESPSEDVKSKAKKLNGIEVETYDQLLTKTILSAMKDINWMDVIHPPGPKWRRCLEQQELPRIPPKLIVSKPMNKTQSEANQPNAGGISLAYLRKFFADLNSEATAYDACEVVKKLTKDCSLFIHLSKTDKAVVKAKADIFVSFAWSSKIRGMLDAIQDTLKAGDVVGDKDDVFLWIDLALVNQNSASEATLNPEALEHLFGSTLKMIGRAIIVFMPIEHPSAVDRVWCVFEWYVISSLDIPYVYCVPKEDVERFKVKVRTGPETVPYSDIFSKINVGHAQAREVSDRDAIQTLIRKFGIVKVNDVATKNLKKLYLDLLDQALQGATLQETWNIHMSRFMLHTQLGNGDLAWDDLAAAQLLGAFSEESQQAANYNMYKASACISSGKFELGLECAQKAVDIGKIAYGPDHVKMAEFHNSLGLNLTNYDTLRAQKMQVEAMASFDPAADIATMMLMVSKALEIDKLMKSGGSMERALVELNIALDIRKRLLGEDHEEVGASLSNISFVYRKLGKNDEAMECLEKALVAFRKRFGDDHITIAVTYGNMVPLTYVQRKWEKTVELWVKAQAVYFRVLGDAHPHVGEHYKNLAMMDLGLGEAELAMKHASIALEIMLLSLSPDHPNLQAMYMFFIDNLSIQRKLWDQAEKYCKLALAIFPPQSLDAANANLKLGSLFQSGGGAQNEISIAAMQKGRMDLAEKYYKKGLDIALDEGYLDQMKQGAMNLSGVTAIQKKTVQSKAYISMLHKIKEVEGLMNQQEADGRRAYLMDNLEEVRKLQPGYKKRRANGGAKKCSIM